VKFIKTLVVFLLMGIGQMFGVVFQLMRIGFFAGQTAVDQYAEEFCREMERKKK
jgi:hypothetical protein